MTSNQIHYAFTSDLTPDRNILRSEYNSKNHVLVRRYKKGQ